MIPISRPYLGEEEAKAAGEAILSGWVTQGPRVNAFEAAFAEYVGARYACAVSSCTAALHIALLAVGVGPGDVVITVSHSFIATANAIRSCGAEPVFVDIDPDTYNMDPNDLRRCLLEDCRSQDGKLYYKYLDRFAEAPSPLSMLVRESRYEKGPLGRVAAIMPVHQMGMPCHISKIVSLANNYGLPVVEDAACAIGSEISFDGGTRWEKIGVPHGDIACFSFHPRKIITTGDGGMITTNDRNVDSKARLLRQHGMSISDTARHCSRKVVFEEYVISAFNYRMTDIQAAVGIEQLKKIHDILEERRRLFTLYAEFLEGIPYLSPPKLPDNVRPNWQSYPVRILQGAPCSQLELMQFLSDKGIATRRGIMNAHQEPPYASAGWSLPVSENARDSVILLPFFPGIDTQDIGYVSSVLRSALAKDTVTFTQAVL